MSEEIIFPEGTSCEINKPLITTQEQPPVKLDSPKNNLPILYAALKASKNKAEAGAAMRKFIAWNDIPPEVWDKLQEMFPLKKSA